MKKALYVCGAILLTVAAVFGVRAFVLRQKAAAYRDRVVPLPANFASLERVAPADVCYLFNPDDRRLMAGYSDLIAAAYVREITGTSYENVETGPDGALTGTPYTHYEVEILYNIKGALVTEGAVPLLQYGGVTIDLARIECISPLLEAGRCYALYLRAAENGCLYVEQAHGIPGVWSREEYLAARAETGDAALLAEHVEAYRHEDLTYAPATRGKSAYEAE